MKIRIKKTITAGMAAVGVSCFLCAGVSFGDTIGEADIQDAAFFHCIRIYDRDQDGVLSEAEREAVSVLNVSGKGITSLAGIEQFPRLEELYCYDNDLTDLDVSASPQLRILDCTNNQIS